MLIDPSEAIKAQVYKSNISYLIIARSARGLVIVTDASVQNRDVEVVQFR